MNINILDLVAPALGVDAGVYYNDLNSCYVLKWSDGIANEWDEEYATLSAALSRLAALVYCGEHEWDLFFTMLPGGHEAEAKNFFEAVCR